MVETSDEASGLSLDDVVVAIGSVSLVGLPTPHAVNSAFGSQLCVMEFQFTLCAESNVRNIPRRLSGVPKLAFLELWQQSKKRKKRRGDMGCKR